jgi:hypothetical protein
MHIVKLSFILHPLMKDKPIDADKDKIYTTPSFWNRECLFQKYISFYISIQFLPASTERFYYTP